MKIVLATGIYPPDIGGPATYVAGFEQELRSRKHEVTVVTYGRIGSEARSKAKNLRIVSSQGNMTQRWFRYRDALREACQDADVVIAFSAVSTGVPLLLTRLKGPKKILRLGGEFFWERATDGGSMKSLTEWYASRFGFWRLINTLFMGRILRGFDGIVYSTAFQRDVQNRAYRRLPKTSVIENPIPEAETVTHRLHDPIRLLFMGRFVNFKNLPVLLETVEKFHDCTLTMTGDGPSASRLREYVRAFGIGDRVTFLPPVHGQAKQKLFAEHDLLVIPSVTEISPNVALEARAAGLPVLLTQDTGLSDGLSRGMLRAPTRDSIQLLSALMKARSGYAQLTAASPVRRGWKEVTDEWLSLLNA